MIPAALHRPDFKIYRDIPLSRKHRKEIDEAFGWTKNVAGMVQTMYRGLERVLTRFIMTMTAKNLARLPRLLAA